MCVCLEKKNTPFKFQHVAFLAFGYDNVIHKITLTIDRSITQRVFLALSALYTFSRTQVRILFSTFWFSGSVLCPNVLHQFIGWPPFVLFNWNIPHSPIFPISGHDSHRWYQSWTALRRFLHSTDTQVWGGGETFSDIERSRVKRIRVFLG